MKRREYLLYAKKIKTTTLFNNSSHQRYRSAILESICWMQTAYGVAGETKFRLNLADGLFCHFGRWQMDYFGDTFHTFLDLDSVIYLAVYGTVKRLLVFIQNILNCVPKTTQAFTGLERHGGK